jgi:hypothetical protein
VEPPKPKHVATLIIIGGIGLFAALQVRTCIKDSKVARRTATDREIHAYFEATVKRALSSPATGEPATLARPILPVVPPHTAGIDRVDAQLDVGVYKNLDPAQRTDDVAAAGSIVIVERSTAGFYVGSGAAGGSVASSAEVTVFDVKSRTVTGKLVVELAQEPDPVATQKMVDDYRDLFDGKVAVHLQLLPPK